LVKVRLKFFFHFDITRVFDQNQIDLAGDRPTLRALLQEVIQKSDGKIQVIEPETGYIDTEYFVLLNGRESQALPQGLETELHDGDEVGIGMMHFWGGG
jgi:molybdopterin converting factor small subunit